MSEPKEKNKTKTTVSLVVLVLVLAALIYGAPRLQSWIAFIKSNPTNEPAAESAQPVTPAAPQCPPELQSWIPLAEQQFPTSEEVGYRLVHMRLSTDETKLLLDIERTHPEKSDRLDLILNRDEFGRYISDHQELPMKLYPPVKPQTEAPPAQVE